MLSVLTRDDFKASNLGANVVLTQPILTVPGRQRIVYRVPIAQLSEVLNKARRQSIKIEHIYDF